MSALCAIAVDAIAIAFTEGERRAPELAGLPPELVAPAATFVTLERDGDLLGCVGALEARQPLAVDVAAHALAAAFDDPRLPALTHSDFAEMSVKVSVLSPSIRIAAGSYDEVRTSVRPDIDGLTVEVGSRRATLLPSVWPKVRDADEFLAALWSKAGLRPGSWPRGVVMSRYTTTEESDPGPRAAL
jgi:AmmeMemoRadiSam system protein A